MFKNWCFAWLLCDWAIFYNEKAPQKRRKYTFGEGKERNSLGESPSLNKGNINLHIYSTLAASVTVE